MLAESINVDHDGDYPNNMNSCVIYQSHTKVVYCMLMMTKLTNKSDVIRSIQDYKVVALATLIIDYNVAVNHSAQANYGY